MRDALQVELPLRALFETPTLAGLAAAITRSIESEVPNLSDEQADALCRGLALNSDPRAA